MKKAAGWLAPFLAVSVCFAQTDTPATLRQRAMAAYQAHDWASFLAFEKRLLTLSPNDPRTIYNVACGEALTAHPAEAMKNLEQLTAWGIDFNADRDKDFSAIQQTADWAKFKAQLEELRKPVVGSSTAFTLPEAGLLAAGLAMDAKSGDTYVASARERKIIRRAKDGTISDFATEKDGLLAVSYLTIDPVRGQLIASMAAMPFMRGYKQEDAGKTAIAIFDLASGKAVKTVFLSGRGDHHLLNASVVDRAGNVFVVDSASHEIYRIRRASNEIELFISSVVYPAPQSLVLSADERTMWVVDYIEGIWAMEILSADRHRLEAAPEIYTAGLLGLVRVTDGFVGVQNGVRPNRVVRFRMDAKGERLTAAETLERNHPAYSGPAQGTMDGNDFIYIANSQLELLDEKTGTFPADKGLPTTILRLPTAK